MRLVRERDGAVVADELALADTFAARLRGLAGRAGLRPAEGLWLEPCDGIHMLFMRFAIDAVFVRRAGHAPRSTPLEAGARAEVLRVAPALRPWLSLARCAGATSTVELPAGRAAALGIEAGDVLVLEAPRPCAPDPDVVQAREVAP